MTSSTDADRLAATRYLYEADKRAVSCGLADLTGHIDALTRFPNLSTLTSVELTVAEMRRRLTRMQLAEEVLR